MNVSPDEYWVPMRMAPCVILLGLLVLLVAASAPPPAAGPVPLVASAPSAGIAITADRSLAGRGDFLNFTVWLNVTGSGQFQRTWVNVSFNTAATPAQNSVSQGPLPWTQPSVCDFKVVSNWFLDWQCVGLRAGTYVWGIPAHVPGNASVGHGQRVLASMYSTIGTSNVSASANETVYIAGAVLRILDVDSVPTESVRGGDLVTYWVNATNDAPINTTVVNGVGTAFNVTVTVELDPGLRPGKGLVNLTTTFPTLPPTAVLSMNLEAIVAPNLAPGTAVGIRVILTYQDFNDHAIGPIEGESSPLYVAQANALSTPNLLAGAAIGLAAVVTTLVVLLYAGQRKILIDEAFLMTKGGILICHLSRMPELRKDDDIVASMFVAIQDFVRDSFRREASLDSIAFGKRRAAVARGELTILAAVMSRGDSDAVAPEILAAVRAIETKYWDVLREWDGNLARLAGVDEALSQLMRGGFRSAWRVQLT